MTRSDKHRITALRAERQAEIDAAAYKPVFREWLKTAALKSVIPEPALKKLARITNPLALSLIAFENIIDPDLEVPELEPHRDYPPHLAEMFASLIAPRPNQRFIRKVA